MSTHSPERALELGWEHHQEAVKAIEACTAIDLNNEQRAILLAHAQVHATLFVGCMSVLARRPVRR